MNKYLIFAVILFMFSCQEDTSLTDIPYEPQEYEIPGQDIFGVMPIPEDNPTTVEGITLGQHLFYDPILSVDSTMSCSSCHEPELAFTDGKAFSPGVKGIVGERSSMSLINLGYSINGLFWDGRSDDLEDQAIHPVEDVIELSNKWSDVEEQLMDHPTYPKMFRKAFGIEDKSEISRDLATKAIAQFERAIVSYDSKFDRVQANEDVFTDEELYGFELFYEINPLEIKDAQCGHCHSGKLSTANKYFNNGLQDPGDEGLQGFDDKGRGLVTNNPIDNGKFRAPTLRNIELTAPYMHDGRLNTLEEVIEHYNSGGHYATNLDPNLVALDLTEEEKSAVVAFIKTLTDTSYLDNPLITNPFE